MKKKAHATLCIAAAVILPVLIMTGLEYAGKRQRIFTPASGSGRYQNVKIAKTSAEMYDFWKNAGLRGRQFVSLSRFLHFVEPAGGGRYRVVSEKPFSIKETLPEIEHGISHRDLLWVAVQAEMARRLYSVLPPETYSRRFSEIAGSTGAGLISEHAIKLVDKGTIRVVTDNIPLLTEPVILFIDASYMKDMEPRAVLALLSTPGFSSDMVTLCASMENPDVTDAERERLRELGRLMEIP